MLVGTPWCQGKEVMRLPTGILQASGYLLTAACVAPSALALEISNTCLAPPTDALFAGTGSVLGESYLRLSDTPCVRIYHKHGYIGCATSEGTAYKARIRGILSDDDLRKFLELPSTHEAEAVVLPWSMFNESVVESLHGTGRWVRRSRNSRMTGEGGKERDRQGREGR